MPELEPIRIAVRVLLQLDAEQNVVVRLVTAEQYLASARQLVMEGHSPVNQRDLRLVRRIQQDSMYKLPVRGEAGASSDEIDLTTVSVTLHHKQ